MSRPVKIGEVALAPAEVETLRVAVADFLMGLAEADALGADEHGRQIRNLYVGHASKIQRLLIG